MDTTDAVTATTKNDPESGAHPDLHLQVQELEALALAPRLALVEQDEEKQTPVKRIKLKRVPSALNLSRRSSVLLQRTASMTLRKRGKKKSGNFHYRSRQTPSEGINVVTQDESESSKSKPPSSPKRLTPWINYEVFQWTWFLTLCILAIADRFTWNVWPRQTYTIGAGSAGSDRLSGFKPG